MYKNILVPIALDHEHKVGAAIDVASNLLDEGGNIIALHVIEAIPPYAAVNLPANYVAQRQSEAMDTLKGELGEMRNVTLEVVTGHAGRTIQEYAKKHGCDCIVVASHRPSFKDHFLGSTAAWVVRHSETSVHVIR